MSTLKELRIEAGFTQKEIAHALDVKQSTVSMWESGANHLPACKLMDIATLYNVPVEKVLQASYTQESDMKIKMVTLRKLRQAAGLTQAGLAEKSGVNIRQIRKIEAGDIRIGNITLTNAARLAAALGVRIEDLLK